MKELMDGTSTWNGMPVYRIVTWIMVMIAMALQIGMGRLSMIRRRNAVKHCSGSRNVISSSRGGGSRDSVYESLYQFVVWKRLRDD